MKNERHGNIRLSSSNGVVRAHIVQGEEIAAVQILKHRPEEWKYLVTGYDWFIPLDIIEFAEDNGVIVV
jgi:hypothetical protein